MLRFSWYWTLFVWIRIRIVFVWIRICIKVLSLVWSRIRNDFFFISWIRIPIHIKIYGSATLGGDIKLYFWSCWFANRIHADF